MALRGSGRGASLCERSALACLNPGASAAKQIDDDQHDGNHEQQVNEASGHVSRQTDQPEYEEDHDQGP